VWEGREENEGRKGKKKGEGRGEKRKGGRGREEIGATVSKALNDVALLIKPFRTRQKVSK